ncbi:hypothetical protein OnM2_018042 [Erysiphe neolycopersici]|uniref:2EXR domain-containing protein n=1 Tax=Erysiphe neolycopersici TaxID=212602 RepID=A0A420I493_9PEZI|nr:hypothetical protein OnM2_018042 [Erysiphe neolycopersici]
MATTPYSPQAGSLLFINGQPKLHNPNNQFHLFGLLPTELRLSIYALSLPRRILTVNYDSPTNSFTSPTALPSLLSTCVESRIVAQKHYSLSFGTNTSKAKIYFNPDLDTLYIPRCSEMGYDEDFRLFKSFIVEEMVEEAIQAESGGIAHANRIEQLRSVAIDYVDAQIKRPWEAYNKASFIRGFPQLDEIILVIADKDEGSLEETQPISSSHYSHRPKSITRWRNPHLPPETILNMWWDFRQSFVTEENVLREVCEETGKIYEIFSLPTVRIKELEAVQSFS